MLVASLSPATSTTAPGPAAETTAAGDDRAEALPAAAQSIAPATEGNMAFPVPGQAQTVQSEAPKPEAARAQQPAPQSVKLVTPPATPATAQVVEMVAASTGGGHEEHPVPIGDLLVPRGLDALAPRGEEVQSAPLVAADPLGLRITKIGIDQGINPNSSTGGEATTVSLLASTYEWHDNDSNFKGEQHDRNQFSSQADKNLSSASAGRADHRIGETVLAFTDVPKAMEDGSARSALSNPGPLRGGPALLDWEKVEGQLPYLQSISLDLEPADLGPVNVRIFMSDRTVHAHIRTDHMDLGQGMLDQQHTLESSLQHSGLEMGQFKVTIDQHGQQRGDSHGLMRQPEDWGQAAGQRAGAADEVQGPRVNTDPSGRTGIMSIFA